MNSFINFSAVLTVPFAKSIACSTEAALEWDESFKTNTDESGRSVLGVHLQCSLVKKVEEKLEQEILENGNIMIMSEGKMDDVIINGISEVVLTNILNV